MLAHSHLYAAPHQCNLLCLVTITLYIELGAQHARLATWRLHHKRMRRVRRHLEVGLTLQLHTTLASHEAGGIDQTAARIDPYLGTVAEYHLEHLPLGDGYRMRLYDMARHRLLIGHHQFVGAFSIHLDATHRLPSQHHLTALPGRDDNLARSIGSLVDQLASIHLFSGAASPHHGYQQQHGGGSQQRGTKLLVPTHPSVTTHHMRTTLYAVETLTYPLPLAVSIGHGHTAALNTFLHRPQLAGGAHYGTIGRQPGNILLGQLIRLLQQRQSLVECLVGEFVVLIHCAILTLIVRNRCRKGHCSRRKNHPSLNNFSAVIIRFFT